MITQIGGELHKVFPSKQQQTTPVSLYSTLRGKTATVSAFGNIVYQCNQPNFFRSEVKKEELKVSDQNR